MIRVWLLRLFRRPVWSHHCKRLKRHVCTFRPACKYLTVHDVEIINAAIARMDVD